MFQTSANTLLDIDLVLKKLNIKESMRVADLGCGSSGHFIFGIAKLIGARGRIYAIDILKTVLETLDQRIRQENFENIETIWSDLEVFQATKIETESLDIGLLINTLYQSKKRIQMLRESIRMIKKGGKLMIVEWKETSSPFGPLIEHRVKSEAIKSETQNLNLNLEDEFEAGQFHYGLLFTKI